MNKMIKTFLCSSLAILLLLSGSPMKIVAEGTDADVETVAETDSEEETLDGVNTLTDDDEQPVFDADAIQFTETAAKSNSESLSDSVSTDVKADEAESAANWVYYNGRIAIATTGSYQRASSVSVEKDQTYDGIYIGQCLKTLTDAEIGKSFTVEITVPDEMTVGGTPSAKVDSGAYLAVSDIQSSGNTYSFTVTAKKIPSGKAPYLRLWYGLVFPETSFSDFCEPTIRSFDNDNVIKEDTFNVLLPVTDPVIVHVINNLNGWDRS